MARQDQEGVLASTSSGSSVRQHRHRHHEVLAACRQAIGVAVRRRPPMGARARRGFVLVSVLYRAPLNVHDLADYVGGLPRKVGLREQGHRLLREVVVRPAPVDRLVVPSRVPDKHRKLVDVEMPNRYLLLAGLLKQF